MIGKQHVHDFTGHTEDTHRAPQTPCNSVCLAGGRETEREREAVTGLRDSSVLLVHTQSQLFVVVLNRPEAAETVW